VTAARARAVCDSTAESVQQLQVDLCFKINNMFLRGSNNAISSLHDISLYRHAAADFIHFTYLVSYTNTLK